MTIMDKAKALIGFAVGGAAVYLSRRYGIDVPPEAVDLTSDLIVSCVGALVTGVMVYLVPNKKAA